MFITGVAGTGKFFLIETIKSAVAKVWPSTDLTCAVLAPTGLAAFNVGGLTIHRLFQLPIEHEGKSATYWSLPKTSQKVMKTTLRNIKLFIIDEVSMVSSLNLAYIHMRLEELFGSGDWFGGKSMLCFGDLLQLEPVNGDPIFQQLSSKTLSYKLGCTTSVNIWRECFEYDELTINERQKKDGQFSAMLDSIRRGDVTDDTIHTLKERVFKGSLSDKFYELQQSGTTPVCLFPTRQACTHFNNVMLATLSTKVHQLECSDAVDESASKRKWTKTAANKLEKLNHDCNMTGGLQANLTLAIGARVMLRRNINTKAGLVNGAIGTVRNITPDHITVQFDHMSVPYNVEKVVSRFMIMKSFYVQRKQFPLILAYAITIHKSQGLSLDNAIIDLSDKVFSAGMAYVALSRLRSLSGLHLLAFDPRSIIVSPKCLQELNRLRQLYRKDLPLYAVPSKTTCRSRRLALHVIEDSIDQLHHLACKVKKTSSTKHCNPQRKGTTFPRKCWNPVKRTTTCSTVSHSSPIKATPCIPNHINPIVTIKQQRKRLLSPPAQCTKHNIKKSSIDRDNSVHLSTHEVTDDDEVTFISTTNTNQTFCYYSVNEGWQQRVCGMLGIQFHRWNRVRMGGPEVTLTPPNPRRIRRITADGNCLFRSFSYIITGSEEHHLEIRRAILRHMIHIAHLLLGHHITRHTSIQDYIYATNMDAPTTWGTDIEILTFSHLIDTPIFTYDTSLEQWCRYSPSMVDRTIHNDPTQMSIYVRHPPLHFDVIMATLPL